MYWFVASRALTFSAFLLGLAAFPAAVGGDPWSWVWGPGGVAVGFHLDVVAVLLVVFVSVLGWVVSEYCGTNLRGRAGLEGVGVALFCSLLSLLATVSGASLVSVAMGWTLSGLAVATLVARAGTPLAGIAAGVMRRNLLVGDALLWSGVAVGLVALPSLERSRLDEIDPGWSTSVVAVLLLGACVARSGLVPAHRWLAETAEAPSPVSALLHAGVVNGAGVLVLLAWPLFSAAPVVLASLVLVGSASVVCGVWTSCARTDVKGRLACSTTSQMGYMCIQLGLGLPSAALMHLMGHGAYKSWLFLRAGGAVARTRALVAPDTNRPARHAPALLAAGLAAVIGLQPALGLVAALGPTAVVPVALGVLAAWLAGRAVGGLRRVTSVASWGVAASAGVLAGGYVWLMLAGEELLADSFIGGEVWGSATGAGLVALVVVAAVAAILGARHLEAHPESLLGVRLLRTALAPMRRGRAVRAWHLPEPSPATLSGPMDDTTLVSAVVLAASVVGPAWPLRNLVAANTLTHLESMSFDNALAVASHAHHVSGRPSLTYFLDLLDSGRIQPQHLRAALEESKERGSTGDEVSSAAGFVAISRGLVTMPPVRRDHAGTAGTAGRRRAQRFCEALPPAQTQAVTAVVDSHSALWAQRAWSGTPHASSARDGLRADGPWERWLQAASHQAYDRAIGITGASAAVRRLPADPVAALGALAVWAEIPADRLVGYLIATFVTAPGWTGHAAWRARRLQDPRPLVELAALRMAHDVLASRAALGGWQSLAEDLAVGGAASAGAGLADEERDRELVDEQARVWQRALEIGIEHWLVTEVTTQGAQACPEELVGAGNPARPTSQSMWCIDVRSERIRRQLEAHGDHHTYGYAGFFGAAVHHLDADGIGHERCPALIEPSCTAHESSVPLPARQVAHRTATAVSSNPLGALVVAEAGGVLAALASTTSVLRPQLMRRLTRAWTNGEGARSGPPTRRHPHAVTSHRRPELTTDLDHDARVELAAAALLTIGLTGNYAPIILICAHGSSTENNAFATAYDCGACGGNDGLVNAVLLADALNDPAVRESLSARGITLPGDTISVAALHDTTTDTVELLPVPGLPTKVERMLDVLATDLRAAGVRAARERQPDLPDKRPWKAASLARRAADWSEPTPEWGLAGNAAILIGPRRLSADTSLRGRVFLHSYERDVDSDGTILEQLLTAPLVVAQWINTQYYFSAVEPDTFGAGDKTTHNVVGDVGVLRGAHGDLRTGLPWQALFRHEPGTRPDSTSLIHEPVRLLALVAADPAHVLRAVTRHGVLTNLVCNEWIHLICLDRGQELRLQRDLTWRTWEAPSRGDMDHLAKPMVGAATPEAR